jgi:YidC/Oxa1 family membrane protein insertase
MTPRARRILIPTIVAAVALGLVLIVVQSRGPRAVRSGEADARAGGAAPQAVASAQDAGEDASGSPQAVAPAGPDESEAPAPPPPPPPEIATGAGTDPLPMTGLRAVAPDTGPSGHDVPPAALGSLDPDEAPFLIEFSRAGAGIERITLSDVWDTAADRREANQHRRAVKAGDPSPPPLPDDARRYVLRESQPLTNAERGAGFIVPTLATSGLRINGSAVAVNLFDYTRSADGAPVYIWAETAPGTFETIVEDADGAPILRITRRFVIGQNYDLTIEQRIENLTDRPLEIEWSQYGPGSLPQDRARYMDRRRYRFGYLVDPSGDRTIVLSDSTDLLFERSDVLKRAKKAAEARAGGDVETQMEFLSLWPNKFSREEGYELSWFGAVNRYFGLTVHAVLDADGRGEHALSGIVDRILLEVSTPDPAGATGSEVVFTYLVSPRHAIPPGRTLALDLGVYAGPLDRSILDEKQPFVALSMGHMILYQMSSFCAICTFQWLAHVLIGFLTILHNYVVFDWGLAIICLVIVVRTILHPLTKKSQVSMQRFGKQMGAMKPELDKLQKKFGHDPKKMQQEQMRLMREHGANPLQMLGCLPMFLQTPIWIALYAMLFFAYDLRHEPAFYGLFQLFAGWPFLADLSAADHFFGEFAEPKRLFGIVNLTGLNMLPLLMGVIFWIQQKYMTPTTTTLTPEQQTQQKIMKVMMIVLFPVMLYNAPSGLTLYILTSSTIGIIESKYIRAHISDMDLKKAVAQAKGPGRAARRAAAATDGGEAPGERRKKKPRDAISRAYTNALERAKEKARNKRKGPDRQFKKRKPE